MSNHVMVLSGVYHTCIHVSMKTISISTLWTVCYYYYVSEHQLSHAVDVSHTTPITRVNRSPKLLKLIGWRHCPYFRWVPYIPGITAQSPGIELGPIARWSITITIETIWDVSHPPEPCSGTVSQLQPVS